MNLSNISIIKRDEIIDSVLVFHKNALAEYYEPYRNHVYRVYNFAIVYVRDKADQEKIAIAAAFHDLGIWTNSTFDYLQPSIALARHYCEQKGLSPDTIAEIEWMINDHHKLNRVQDSRLAEIFRQADLTDLSLGLIRNGQDFSRVKAVRNTFPNKGFHLFLLRTFAKNLLKNPLNPLPVVKF